MLGFHQYLLNIDFHEHIVLMGILAMNLYTVDSLAALADFKISILFFRQFELYEIITVQQ